MWLPPWHFIVPGAHTPGRPVAQAAPPPGLFSSTVPSQSLSMLSQVSAEGARLGLQVSTAPWHVTVPFEHWPSSPLVQAPPPPGLPSSGVPSQSLSTPSHVSAPGATVSRQTI